MADHDPNTVRNIERFPRCYGPEFRGRALAAWSEERGVRLEFIQLGKHVQNAYVESFNDSIQEGSRQPRLHWRRAAWPQTFGL